jgi:hypothetical protein
MLRGLGGLSGEMFFSLVSLYSYYFLLFKCSAVEARCGPVGFIPGSLRPGLSGLSGEMFFLFS